MEQEKRKLLEKCLEEKIKLESERIKITSLVTSKENIYANSKEIQIKKEIICFLKDNVSLIEDEELMNLISIPNLIEKIYLEYTEKENLETIIQKNYIEEALQVYKL